MTFADRAAILVRQFGLRRRHAEFVTLVALIGGYCLRRQYESFAHIKNGKNSREFLESLVCRGLAVKSRPCANRGWLYHVKQRSLYRALGLTNNRNRRIVGPPRQARRVMLLDYAIAHHADAVWYATEDEKVDLFARSFGTPLVELPSRVYRGAAGATTTRRFVAKLPIYQMRDETVCLVMLGLETTGRTVASFLSDHAALLSAVPAWKVVVAYPRVFQAGIHAWHAAFRSRYFTGPIELSAGDAIALHLYFRVRCALAGGPSGGLTIDRSHEERRRRFAGTPFEELYPFWLAQNGAARHERDPPDFSRWRPAGRLELYELPHSYDLFGRYPGVA